MQHFATGALALMLALALPVSAQAEQAATANGSMKAAIDQKTGQLRPLTATEEAELAQAEAKLNQSAASNQKQTLKTQKSTASKTSANFRPKTEGQALDTAKLRANGAIQIRVPQDLDSQVTARRGANGELIIEESNQNGPEVVNE